ncbi:MAG: HIT family protein [Alphaproteobacteria bacterium]
MPEFELHPQLAADTVSVCAWPLCEVLLLTDANYPWLVLVPVRPDLRDFHDLSPDDMVTAGREIARASEALVELFAPDKVNVAALGNMVPQLHIHVVARHTHDAAWPKPIWGVVPPLAYAPDALDARLADLRRVFG